MLHHQEKETMEFTAVNINIKKTVDDSAAELEHLQTQRKKANKTRKAYWQKRIDDHFGLK